MAYRTNQERVDALTLQISNPNIVGSGFIQHPPQRPFERPVLLQPETIKATRPAPAPVQPVSAATAADEGEYQVAGEVGRGEDGSEKKLTKAARAKLRKKLRDGKITK
ncbi:hypothetical protein APUTEX25_000515 [Auxenochlorella protothecoides]|uniref:Uncharacterized protein n=1 Tax=Auxenochlorella protothecoides TaxID=3075 RepID=A0A3M7KWU8_AUXPR|nr:hypothetical protein APUTEX25_000515 [Auxenochlorella protothecoides]|eukprot:RMZ54998.1 hypothetical protein APUTEX25_000515 [Auxenochlorella protothecoides]